MTAWSRRGYPTWKTPGRRASHAPAWSELTRMESSPTRASHGVFSSTGKSHRSVHTTRRANGHACVPGDRAGDPVGFPAHASALVRRGVGSLRKVFTRSAEELRVRKLNRQETVSRDATGVLAGAGGRLTLRGAGQRRGDRGSTGTDHSRSGGADHHGPTGTGSRPTGTPTT